MIQRCDGVNPKLMTMRMQSENHPPSKQPDTEQHQQKTSPKHHT